MAEVQTCPKCGALISRELERCRRCNTYLHGTALEGALLGHLLPEGLRAHPGTATIMAATLLYYALMVALAAPVDPRAVVGFSGFSLLSLGATEGGRILLGEHWRFVTSVLAHHDLVHLAFNLSALASVGPIVEELFDRKKMLLAYAVSGPLSMVASFYWYVFVLGQVSYVSAGASGAVSAMVGAAMFGARRRVLDGRPVARRMAMWSVSLVLWGLMMPAVNNAAHLGGWVVGALFGHLMPLGLASSVRAHRALSAAALTVVAGALASVAMMLATLRGFPASLAHEALPRRVLGIPFAPGADEGEADAPAIESRCLAAQDRGGVPSAEDVHACELNARVSAWNPGAYLVMADVLLRAGQHQASLRYLAVGQRMIGGLERASRRRIGRNEVDRPRVGLL